MKYIKRLSVKAYNKTTDYVADKDDWNLFTLQLRFHN